jgi:hypothetical protein
MLVFLTEEPSMTPILRRMMTTLGPDCVEGLDWQVITHQGKADLQKNMVHKMRSWNYNSPYFIILRDNDGGDCKKLKHELLKLAAESGKPFHVRIVCQELEAWFLGDLPAIEAAFPRSNASGFENQSLYRSPDQATNANDLVQQLTGTSAKVGRAESIAPHLNIFTNRSPSFNLLVATIRAQILNF